MLVREFIRKLDQESNSFYNQKAGWIITSRDKTIHNEKLAQWLSICYTYKVHLYEILGNLIPRVSNPTLCMLMGRLVGDEAKHAFYIRKRLKELGSEPSLQLPEQEEVISTIRDTIYPEEFFAMLTFGGEKYAFERQLNDLIFFDGQTIEIFQKYINKDDAFHISMLPMCLAFYCVTKQSQDRAYIAVRSIREKYYAMFLAQERIIA
jgi:hypothetical protein